MSYHYRCNHRVKGETCNTRIALKRKVEDYKRKPKCPTCESLLTFRDKRHEKMNKLNTCFCDGVHFPHRAGSTVWCKQHPTGPTEQDHKERYGDYD